MSERLLMANLRNHVEPPEEVSHILAELQERLASDRRTDPFIPP